MAEVWAGSSKIRLSLPRRRERDLFGGRPEMKRHIDTAAASTEFAIEAAAGRQMALLARCAGVHVDFHAHRHFDDLRCFPGHFVLPSKSWRKPRAARQARTGLSRAQAGLVGTRLRCWTCRNGRRLADACPALKRLGNSDIDPSGIFLLPGSDAPISRPDCASQVLPKSEIATFFVMRGIQRQYLESARRGSPASPYLSRRSRARPARDFSSFASSVPSLSGSAALKRCSTTARYSSSVRVPS
ncbi:hypothetical protein BRSPCE3_36200 [Bradyrhizobium sp. Ce-3]|nr:hypothetical protein BRSPCE3_36200 [Bradyrhizobium sp. Ce-3]